MDELEIILKALGKKYPQDKIEIDFSISVALEYYNGLIFKGYISDIRKPILSGEDTINSLHDLERVYQHCHVTF